MKRDLREKRAKALADARAIHEVAVTEDRTLSTEESDRYDKFMADYNSLSETIERSDKLDAEQARMDEIEDRVSQVAPQAETSNPEEARAAAFRTWLATGRESRVAPQADVDTAGGYITAPPAFVAQLIKDVDDQVFMRGLSNTFSLGKAESIGVPSLDTDVTDPTWTSEILTGTADTTVAFGKRELTPHPLAKSIRVSNKLLRNAALSGGAEGFVRERLAYKFGLAQEKAFMTGDGANSPLGVFTASSSGISTDRDVSTGNSTTAMTTDGLKEAKYTLKGGYHSGASFVFHRDGVKQIAKLKDGNGRYLWEDSIVTGEPSRLLGFPVHMSENAPNTFTTGLYVGILGNFKQGYWIADSLNFEVQRLTELYAATNQVGFIGRLEADGMPVNENAFVRVTLA